jgi:hypothetical protein
MKRKEGRRRKEGVGPKAPVKAGKGNRGQTTVLKAGSRFGFPAIFL